MPNVNNYSIAELSHLQPAQIGKNDLINLIDFYQKLADRNEKRKVKKKAFYQSRVAMYKNELDIKCKSQE
jgi:hypothetical protein